MSGGGERGRGGGGGGKERGWAEEWGGGGGALLATNRTYSLILFIYRLFQESVVRKLQNSNIITNAVINVITKYR